MTLRPAALALCVAAGALGAGPAPDEMEVPVGRQVELFARALAFDRHLAGDGPLVLAVVYQGGSRDSRRAYDDVAAAARAGLRVQRRPVRVVGVDVGAGAPAARDLQRAGAAVAYVAPLRGVDVRAFARSAAGAGVLTLTGVRGYVGAGVGLGVGLRDGRPEILLNRRAAEASGADFSARLLQLATLVD